MATVSIVSKMLKLRDKARTLTAAELAAEGLSRANKHLTRSFRRAIDRQDATYISDDELARSVVGGEISAMLSSLRSPTRPMLTAGLTDLKTTVRDVSRIYPLAPHDTVSRAAAILEHKITLFERGFQLGSDIDWHQDPASKARWPLVHYTRVPIRIGGGADARIVWELNRMHHLVTLGQAYAYTRDERFTEEFLIQIASWYRLNPPKFGINWTVAMEAAIRSVNIIAALGLFRDSVLLDDTSFGLIVKLLISHARFIADNLESSPTMASNHYLSDLIGLFVIAASLPELTESPRWIETAASELIREMDRQILPDGVDYEGSTAYHRFVLELYFLFFHLCGRCGIKLPTPHFEKLEAMFDFVRHYLKPDRTAPLIGDSDDGRIIRFKDRPAVDQSYLMSLGAVLFNSGDFRRRGAIDEEAIWWLGSQGIDTYDKLPAAVREPVSKQYGNAQIFIQRSGSLYAIIDCGDHGAMGRGSHAHSDALSIDLYAYGRTLLRDPGTFVYSASELWRNRFRSTAYHNTVRIDREEISELIKGQPFTLGPNRPVTVNKWETSVEQDLLDAQHNGYSRLEHKILHRRALKFCKGPEYWILEDYFTDAVGEPDQSHLIEFFFNFDAGLQVTFDDNGRAFAKSRTAALALIPVSGHTFETRIATRWVSLSYGTRKPSFGIMYSLYATIPFSNRILLIPYKKGDESKVEDVVAKQAAGGEETGKND
jgi:hypothetical protein